MCQSLVCYKDGQDFSNIIGKEILKWYKEIDGWHSLIIIDEKKQMITNIADVNNLDMFPSLKFLWLSARAGDSQAITDGYVNIKN
jgi:hypothetical protein